MKLSTSSEFPFLLVLKPEGTLAGQKYRPEMLKSVLLIIILNTFQIELIELEFITVMFFDMVPHSVNKNWFFNIIWLWHCTVMYTAWSQSAACHDIYFNLVFTIPFKNELAWTFCVNSVQSYCNVCASQMCMRVECAKRVNLLIMVAPSKHVYDFF